MIEERERFERAFALFEMPEPALERLVRRRDRQRRLQRITAGAVGIAVFVAAAGLATALIQGAPDTTRSVPAPTPGFIGLPPDGTTPSTPVAGEVVLRANGRCAGDGPFCHLWLYADGRLIWIMDDELPFGANEDTTGLLEQRLTPEGVELLRSEFLSTGTCTSTAEPVDCFGGMPGPAPFPRIPAPGWIDPGWGLPASAWADPEIRAFVPSRFGACVLRSNIVAAGDHSGQPGMAPSRVLALLPAPAAALLVGKDDVPFRGMLDAVPATCFAVATAEARTLNGILLDAGSERDEHMSAFVLGYHIRGPGQLRDAVIWFGPMLPHGEWIVTGFG